MDIWIGNSFTGICKMVVNENELLGGRLHRGRKCVQPWLKGECRDGDVAQLVEFLLSMLKFLGSNFISPVGLIVVAHAPYASPASWDPRFNIVIHYTGNPWPVWAAEAPVFKRKEETNKTSNEVEVRKSNGGRVHIGWQPIYMAVLMNLSSGVSRSQLMRTTDQVSSWAEQIRRGLIQLGCGQ